MRLIFASTSVAAVEDVKERQICPLATLGCTGGNSSSNNRVNWLQLEDKLQGTFQRTAAL